MGMFSFEGVSSTDRVLIHRFVEQYYQALGFIKAKKYEDGKKAYSLLLELFKQLNQRERLAEIHKQLAYNCVRDIYSNLSEMESGPLSDKTFKMLLSITIIILLLGLLFILKPDLAGMFSAELGGGRGPTWTAGINTFLIDSIAKFDLDNFFSAKGDLEYSVATGEGVDVILSNSILVVMPKPGFRGESEISIIAFQKGRPGDYTKVPLRFIIS